MPIYEWRNSMAFAGANKVQQRSISMSASGATISQGRRFVVWRTIDNAAVRAVRRTMWMITYLCKSFIFSVSGNLSEAIYVWIHLNETAREWTTGAHISIRLAFIFFSPKQYRQDAIPPFECAPVSFRVDQRQRQRWKWRLWRLGLDNNFTPCVTMKKRGRS